MRFVDKSLSKVGRESANMPVMKVDSSRLSGNEPTFNNPTVRPSYGKLKNTSFGTRIAFCSVRRCDGITPVDEPCSNSNFPQEKREWNGVPD